MVTVSLVTSGPRSGSVSRRRFLSLTAAGMTAGLLLPSSLVRVRAQTNGIPIGPDHLIRPRDVWGVDLPPKDDMLAEAPEDVRFLLVHHSSSPNDYSTEESIGYLRSFYRYHTSDEKAWPDIAYNFLVDRWGQIFEGRQGSIASPVRGDATGGSQGFALLACFIGDHSDVAPTEEAQAAMVALLAWLGVTYRIDTRPGATAEFVSRGSNLHPEGKLVVTPTITGHRTMSRTTCPGDKAFELVESTFPEQVTAVLSGDLPASTTTAVASTTSTAVSVSTTQSRSEPASAAPVATQPTDAPEHFIQDTGDAPDIPVVTGGGSSPGHSQKVLVRHRSRPHIVPADTVAGAAPTVPAAAAQNTESSSGRPRGILGIVGAGICAAGLGAEVWYRRRRTAREGEAS